MRRDDGDGAGAEEVVFEPAKVRQPDGEPCRAGPLRKALVRVLSAVLVLVGVFVALMVGVLVKAFLGGPAHG